MVPINNASKYYRTVAVYVDDESLIIVLASACKWPIKAILMLPRALGFSVWCMPNNSYLVFSFWVLVFAFFYDNVTAIRCIWNVSYIELRMWNQVSYDPRYYVKFAFCFSYCINYILCIVCVLSEKCDYFMTFRINMIYGNPLLATSHPLLPTLHPLLVTRHPLKSAAGILNLPLFYRFSWPVKHEMNSFSSLWIKNVFLKHKQANINVESRRFGVITTPF